MVEVATYLQGMATKTVLTGESSRCSASGTSRPRYLDLFA
jgi:hypothetical protein